MAKNLSSTLSAMHRIKATSAGIKALLMITRAILLGMVTVSIWALVRPQQELEQLALGALAIVIAMFAGLRRTSTSPRITIENLALALEMKHSATTKDGLPLEDPERDAAPEWEALLQKEVKELRAFEASRNLALLSSLALPLAISFLTLPNAAPSLKLALSEVSNAVSMLTRGATLKVMQGAVDEKSQKETKLSEGSPVALELLAQNLIEIKVTGAGKKPPVVELRRAEAKDTVFQTFQMLPIRDGGDDQKEEDEGGKYSISFAVTEDVELSVPMLSDKALAKIKVRQLPTPKVKLTVTSELEDPWPDDQPLGLRIQVKAENPLQIVRLLIRSGQRVSKELVANVLAEDKTELTTDYRLLLEQYVESDLAQVEIVAEAIDRSVPQPLAGYSEPLKLNTASAYGRYRQTLQTLRELKTHVDEALQQQTKELPKEANELASKAAEQSEKSPFFDGLDRVQIHRFESKIDENAAEPDQEKILDLSQQINDFLFEHEILDDRERDRDFFVAARGLSRLLEQDHQKRPVQTKVVTERIKKFLDDRYERWEKRVERLPQEFKPEKWGDIRDKKPFHGALEKIDKLDDRAKGDPNAKADQLTALSKAVVDYRQWIENLEAQEDKTREQEERQRQEGLASARDTMKELQKRQGEISAELDRAGERQTSDLDSQWPATRMKQNANTRETRRLEGQMRSLAPNANARLLAAIQAMEGTSEAGSTGNYQLAESSSDLAGRLLRQAERAASQQQQKRRNRGRRRRVTGDNYYGQSVVGGDIEIKREYQVDRRYREDILEEVQGANYDEENQSLLENYLRQVIR